MFCTPADCIHQHQHITSQSNNNYNQPQQGDEEGDKLNRHPLEIAQFCELLSKKKLHKL